MNNKPRINQRISGSLPEIHGDKFRPNDYIVDKLYNQGKIGDILELFSGTSGIVSGLAVSKNVSTNTLDITAGIAIVRDSSKTAITLHDFDGTALTPDQTIPVRYHVLPYAGVTAQAITGSAELAANGDGVTVNYVKLRYTEIDEKERQYASNSSLAYYFVTEEQFQLYVNTTAPTADDVVLAQFTWDGGSTFVFSTANRTADATTKALNDTISVAASSLLIKEVSNLLSFDFSGTSGDRTYKFPDRDHQIGGVEDWVTAQVYYQGEFVVDTGTLYRCTLAGDGHTSGTFATDVGSGYWEVVGGGGSSVTYNFTQASPSLDIGNPVYFDGVEWQKAQANDSATAATGIIISKNVNDYSVQFAGSVTLSTGQWDAVAGTTGGLTAGTTYRVSDTVAGEMVTTVPSLDNPVLFAVSTTDAICLFKFVAAESGAGNNIVTETFSGDESNDTFTLANTPISKPFMWVFVDSVYQYASYSISGNDIVFDTPPPLGTNNVIIQYVQSLPFSDALSQYTNRQTFSIADAGTTDINTIFGSKDSGFYHLWQVDDPRNYARIYYRGGTGASVELDGIMGSVKDDSGFVNIYWNGTSSDVEIQNLTGGSLNFVMRREV